MFTKDVAKARIKKLEGDMLGLVYRLKNLNAHPGFFSTTSEAFNAGSAKPSLNKRFHSAGNVQDALKREISAIRDELTALMPYTSQELEFRMAA